jgi:hypothetical protein
MGQPEARSPSEKGLQRGNSTRSDPIRASKQTIAGHDGRMESGRLLKAGDLRQANRTMTELRLQIETFQIRDPSSAIPNIFRVRCLKVVEHTQMLMWSAKRAEYNEWQDEFCLLLYFLSETYHSILHTCWDLSAGHVQIALGRLFQLMGLRSCMQFPESPNTTRSYSP